MKTELRTTDPSTELWALAERLRGVTNRESETKPSHHVIANQIGVPTASADFMDIVAAISRRAQALIVFATNVQDDELHSELRNDVIRAATSLMQLVLPNHLVMNWKDARTNFLMDKHLQTLKWFGQTARRHRPLRVIDESELSKLRNRITELITEFQGAIESHWSYGPLLDGLDRLQRVLKYLPFFGHEAAIEQLVFVAQQAVAIKEAADCEPTSHRGPHIPVLKFFNIIVLAGALFCLPDQIAGALSRYRSWGLDETIRFVEQHQQPRLLPAPDNHKPHPPEPTKDALEVEQREE